MPVTPRASVLLALLALSHAPAVAQVVSGTLVDAESRAPIADAVVVLVDASEAEVARATTDPRGAYLFRTGRQGAFWMRAQAAGFAPVESRPFVLARGDSLVLDFGAVRRVEQLQGVTVAAPNPQSRAYAGFLERSRFGMGGRFHGPDWFERMKPVRLSTAVVPMLAGLRVNTSTGAVTYRGRGRRVDCAPKVFVDGHPSSNLLDAHVTMGMVRAVEVYRDETTFSPRMPVPVSSAPCGLILIWTRVGIGDDGADAPR